MKETEDKNIFEQRIDFYWQSIVIYAIILISYSIFKGTIDEGSITLVYADPVVYLLTSIIIGSLISYLMKFYRLTTLTVGKDFLLFKNRFGEKIIKSNDIEKMISGKEQMFQVRERYRVLKIKVKGRKRLIKIKPYLYWDDMKLFKALEEFRGRI